MQVMYTPTREGMCTSPVASMVRTHDFVMGQELNMFICNELNARPPLFLTTASASFNETNLVDGSGINAESEFKSQLIRCVPAPPPRTAARVLTERARAGTRSS